MAQSLTLLQKELHQNLGIGILLASHCLKTEALARTTLQQAVASYKGVLEEPRLLAVAYFCLWAYRIRMHAWFLQGAKADDGHSRPWHCRPGIKAFVCAD